MVSDHVNPTLGTPAGSRTLYLEVVLDEPRATRAALAREAKVTASYVSHVLARRKPASRKLREAAERLTGIPAEVLFAEVGRDD